MHTLWRAGWCRGRGGRERPRAWPPPGPNERGGCPSGFPLAWTCVFSLTKRKVRPWRPRGPRCTDRGRLAAADAGMRGLHRELRCHGQRSRSEGEPRRVPALPVLKGTSPVTSTVPGGACTASGRHPHIFTPARSAPPHPTLPFFPAFCRRPWPTSGLTRPPRSPPSPRPPLHPGGLSATCVPLTVPCCFR